MDKEHRILLRKGIGLWSSGDSQPTLVDTANVHHLSRCWNAWGSDHNNSFI